MKLLKFPANVPVVGVNGTRSQLHHKVVVQLRSNCSDFTTNLDCYTVPKVTDSTPAVRVNIDSWSIPPGILLADDSFHRPNEIEMLIGAELFAEILKQGRIKISDCLPSLIETEFGWTVTGPYDDQESDSLVCGLANKLPGKDMQPMPVGKSRKNALARTSEQQQPTTIGLGSAFQRAGVCSRTYAPNDGSSMVSCATTNHCIGTIIDHRDEARALTRADETSASSSERVSAVRSCRECSSEPHRRNRHHRHHRLSSSSPCR
ncbi:hypothetical protein RP20_CCG019348 [Aedes albopictus]|nr:hypothetical protein RP20_CCG019348 [Aedes albopictus]